MAETDLTRKAIVDEICRQYDGHVKTRNPWTNTWCEIRDLVRPTVDQMTNATPGQPLTEKIFDATPTWALMQLSSGLGSFLTSQVTRWFNLGFEGVPYERIDNISRIWLNVVADIIYNQYSRPEANFTSSLHETYLDVSGFGTAALHQEWSFKRRGLLFRAIPIVDCLIDEDDEGMVDHMFRLLPRTRHQLYQQFGEGNLPLKVRENTEVDKTYQVLHAVIPRDNRDVRKVTKNNMPWGSYWILYETKDLLLEGGYNEFCYHVPRWTRMAGEKYGRSPAMEAMPDIKMLNKMSQTVIKSAQKMVDPPLQVPDDGFIGPISTKPGALMYYTPGTEDRVIPLETKGHPEIGEALMEQRRQSIIRTFFVDYLQQQKNNVEMTATEVMDRRQEKFRMMGPIIGRLETELLGPMLTRSYNLLVRAGMIPKPPRQAAGRQIKVTYIGAASTAQRRTKLQNIQSFGQTILGVANFAPSVLDLIDTDKTGMKIADLTDLPPELIRTPEQIAGIRQQRAQQQQQALQMGNAAAGAGIAKDLAQAKATGAA